jgi:hypothetical protein
VGDCLSDHWAEILGCEAGQVNEVKGSGVAGSACLGKIAHFHF